MLTAIGPKTSRARRLSQTSGDPRDPQPTPDGKRVIFASGSNRLPLSRELYSVSTEAEDQVQLTDRRVNLSWQPAISPDGKKIAYVVEKEGHSDLHVMNIDGSENSNITNTNKGYWSPKWSPDGQHIVATSRDSELGTLELLKIAADGTSKTQLTDFGLDIPELVFSPTGSHIVFGASPGMGIGILCSIRADGSNFKSYATELNMTGAPTVSPQGEILFSATNGGGNYGIYGVKLESDEPAELVIDSNLAFSPTFSPDGSKFAFIEADDSFNFQVLEANADGKNIRRLTEPGSDNTGPSYTADGKSIVFVSNKEGKPEVYKQDLS